MLKKHLLDPAVIFCSSRLRMVPALHEADHPLIDT
jgi:hypothetical protein